MKVRILYFRAIMPSKFSKKERPILINNWEATYFWLSERKLLELADEAKKVE